MEIISHILALVTHLCSIAFVTLSLASQCTKCKHRAHDAPVSLIKNVLGNGKLGTWFSDCFLPKKGTYGLQKYY